MPVVRTSRQRDAPLDGDVVVVMEHSCELVGQARELVEQTRSRLADPALAARRSFRFRRRTATALTERAHVDLTTMRGASRDLRAAQRWALPTDALRDDVPVSERSRSGTSGAFRSSEVG